LSLIICRVTALWKTAAARFKKCVSWKLTQKLSKNILRQPWVLCIYHLNPVQLS
jgi:hypothetical protein